MKKGEIWTVDIPGVSGHEQHGHRPAVIIADTQTTIAIIIPCTSNIHALRFPYALRLNPSKRNGLETVSVALVLQIRAIDKLRLQRKIGTIGKSMIQEIDTMIRRLLLL